VPATPLPHRVRAFAPGRVNLIGEHTDYNDGLCLPFTIERGVTVDADAIEGDEVLVRASDLDEEDRFALADPPRGEGWRAFARGAVAELRAAGHTVPAARLAIAGDVPRGAGLSSSAALEVALCLALLALGGTREVDRLALARLCSRVENEWVGARTGLLDQVAALCAREGHALRVDCRTLDVEPVPLTLEGWTLATVASGAERAHAVSGYNARRAECAQAVHALGLRSLREAREEDLDRLDGVLRRRARHVVGENARVEHAVRALRRRDPAALAPLLDASHASLRDDFEVSVDAVEEAVGRLKRAGAAGARMIGGGFGGSVLALFPPGARLPEDALAVSAGPAARVLDARA
jgi:galactokinase